MAQVWRTAARKNKPKTPPHLVRISKNDFYEGFMEYPDDDGEPFPDPISNEILFPIIRHSVFRLQDGTTKLTVDIRGQGYCGPWNEHCERVRIYLKGHAIWRLFYKSSVDNDLLLTREGDTFTACCSFAPEMRTEWRRVMLVRQVNVPDEHLPSKMDVAMLKMGIIDIDGDYLLEED